MQPRHSNQILYLHALKSISNYYYYYYYYYYEDRFCDLEVRVPGNRSRGPGSIPGATTFSEK
jgi:hypothetical protein